MRNAIKKNRSDAIEAILPFIIHHIEIGDEIGITEN
jgi:hypothetical protein